MKKGLTKVLRKVVTGLCVVAMMAAMTGCGNKVTKIGISQYGEHASLDNCRIGFLEGLKQAGLEEGKDFEVDYQNAGFDDSIATQIGQSFSANNVNLMVAIATPSATACFAAAEDKDIPVIFTAITDPVKSKLTEGNITGTSDKLPVEAQLDLIRKIQPDAKTIGIVYTTSESNSISAIEEYNSKAADYGFTINAIGVTAQAEVTQAVDKLISDKVDCISNLTDNNVVGVLASTLEKTKDAKIPVYGSEIEQVKIGCVAAAGIDYVELGIRTGLMAAKVIKGEAKCADMPFESISEYGIYLNSDVLAELNITVSDDIMSSATDVCTAE